MSIPGYTADASAYARSGYRSHVRHAAADSGSIVPAIPYCDNCDYIPANCERNGRHPRGLCNMCAAGMCYEAPPPGRNP